MLTRLPLKFFLLVHKIIFLEILLTRAMVKDAKDAHITADRCGKAGHSEKKLRKSFRLVLVHFSAILHYSDHMYFIEILVTLYMYIQQNCQRT